MRATILALSFCLIGAVAQAQAQNAATTLDVTAPQEVGNTTMPPGNYMVTEQSSGKSYNLMVSSKGTMILAPAAKACATTPATTVAVPAAAAASAIVPVPPAPGTIVAVPPGAAPAAGAGGGLTGMLNNPMASGAMKSLMGNGTTKMIEKSARKEINKFLK